MRQEISACGVASAGMTSRRTVGIAQRSLATLLGALLLIGSSVALASPALAQATRTWVSGVGDDANPCSRTAPCKTFAGAIGKTAIGGEINALDSGGFGAVTITKSITIDASSAVATAVVRNVRRTKAFMKITSLLNRSLPHHES